MTVLILSFSATMLLLPGIQTSSVDTELANEGLAIAKQALEEQQSLARKDFRLVLPQVTTETIGGIAYTKTIEVETDPDAVDDHFSKSVRAIVSWGGLFGRSQNVTLTTRVTDFENSVSGDTCDSIAAGTLPLLPPTSHLFGSLVRSGGGPNDSSGTYPLSDIEVHRDRMLVSVLGSQTSIGALSPDVGSNSTSAGTLAWSNPTRVTGSDNQHATRVMNGTAATNYLRANDFDFTVPAGATVLGIRFEIERSRSSGGGTSNEIRDNEVKVVKADGTVGAVNKFSASNWPTSDAYASYGDTTDLWGERWRAADINDSDFGVVLSARGASATGTNRTAQVDHVRATVWYIRQFYSFNVAATPTLTGELSITPPHAPVAAGYTALTVAQSSTYGHYAFAATNSVTAHVQTIDLGAADPSVIESYRIDAAPNARATAIFFKDGYLYVGTEANPDGPEFFVLPAHNPSDFPAPLSSIELGAGINALYIRNNQAYLATNDSNRELITIDLTDLADPSLLGSYNAPGAAPGQGKSLSVIGDTLYLGRYYSSSGPELMVFDISDATPVLRGSQDIGTSGNTIGAYGTLVRNNFAFLLTGNSTTNSNGAMRVYNVKNPAAIAAVSNTVSLPNSGAPVALDCEDTSLFVASTPSTGSFQNRGSITVITSP